jgi:hypothetical protein
MRLPEPPGPPIDLRALDASAVQHLLHRLHPEARVESVEILERAACGDGLASTADRITVGLRYAAGHDAGLPHRMILKTLLLHPLLRFGPPSILALARASRAAEALPGIGAAARAFLFGLVGVYQRYFPHAPDPMYVNEVRFYTELRPSLELEAPAAYGGHFDTRNRHFGILMEDLRLRGAHFPNALEELPLATLRDLLRQLARLHGRFWRSAQLEGELAWLPDRLSGGMYPVFEGIGRELIRHHVRDHQARAALIRPLGRSIDELWRDVWAAQRVLASGPLTLLHGDTHVGNTYTLPDGTGGLYDFQLTVRGHWANDFAYLVITALRPETRRREERALLRLYLDELARHGATGVPSTDAAWRDYRLAAIWGLVIGWLITPTANYGPAITEANIARLVSACADLEAFHALP